MVVRKKNDMKQFVIEVKNLCVSYGIRKVLHNVSLNVGAQDYIGITGPNGGGKTTLLRCILGLLKPTSGSIELHSLRTPGAAPVIGYLPQFNRIDPKFPITVGEVLLSGLDSRKRLTARLTEADRALARQVLQRMGLEKLEYRPIDALSGGQLQRALLGRAIISDPEVLVLDEPGTYIDKQFEARLYPLLREMNRTCAILLVSHDIPTLQHEAKAIVQVGESGIILP